MTLETNSDFSCLKNTHIYIAEDRGYWGQFFEVLLLNVLRTNKYKEKKDHRQISWTKRIQICSSKAKSDEKREGLYMTTAKRE